MPVPLKVYAEDQCLGGHCLGLLSMPTVHCPNHELLNHNVYVKGILGFCICSLKTSVIGCTEPRLFTYITWPFCHQALILGNTWVPISKPFMIPAGWERTATVTLTAPCFLYPNTQYFCWIMHPPGHTANLVRANTKLFPYATQQIQTHQNFCSLCIRHSWSILNILIHSN